MLAVCKIWFLFLIFAQFLSADTLIEKKIIEELLTLASIEGDITGFAIHRATLEQLREAGLSLTNSVSVTTDGTPAMTGKKKIFLG